MRDTLPIHEAKREARMGVDRTTVIATWGHLTAEAMRDTGEAMKEGAANYLHRGLRAWAHGNDEAAMADAVTAGKLAGTADVLWARATALECLAAIEQGA